MNIRLITKDDARQLADYYSTNAHHFHLSEPIRATDYYSAASLQARLSEYEEQHRLGSAAHFIGLDDGRVIAHCSLTNIVYGAFRACFIGYGVSKDFEGTGAMRKLCQAAILYAFEELELNRVMANYMPCNTRSGNLLQKLGFAKEGLAKKYLKINGCWEDHVLTSLVNPANLEQDALNG
ncbi:GNAT family N-acetyltransferase [Rheinheimera riviphila]|uniref:GNAT family N-acetyltransferase n=1 Tax=Rheinheimera riviphila TaxID=1834037 RepID=A0A437QR76_9GAMM|nr:GNAT family N-acetyltransferase [Rheinheimera riviphila]RVU37011.1 GNAT family N-acetyltransferase [Rheinheimera riviphila]